MTDVDYSKTTPIPDNTEINTDLHALHAQDMIDLFGIPGKKTENCSHVTNTHLQKLLLTKNVGPFSVTGLGKLVLILTDIFHEVKETKPELYHQVKSAGMLCCRHIRGYPATYSNHSWGSAIDLYFGDAVTPQGSNHIQLGLAALYWYFHKHKFYWGSEFKPTDAMHFEASKELLEELYHNK